MRRGLAIVSGGEAESRFGWARSARAVAGSDLRTDRPHTARVYDYYLGGKDHYPADREAAEKTLAVMPNVRTMARQNRAFMRRATRYLAGEAGIRQFLDIGTGIPTSPNLHEVAQSVAPDSRIVYADNDPIVLAYARALLGGTPEGRTAYLDADLHDPESILGAPELRETLDLTAPVALSLVAIMHFVQDKDDPYGLVRRYLDALPAGSFLTLSQFSDELTPEETVEAIKVYSSRGLLGQARTQVEIGRFFDGLDLVDPGVTLVHRWRPDEPLDESLTDAAVSIFGGVARKP
ncbi:SAM-dependent methyltransferase [Frankia umida]|uniref:SAM-dependent methyltransferase n=1 Tax=Frankia umida TaxID=573489 RepID=UPI0035573AF3